MTDAAKMVDERQEELVALLSQAIQYESVNDHRTNEGHEYGFQMFISEKLRDIGLELDVFEPDIDLLKVHAACPREDGNYEGRPNVVGLLGGSGGGRSLILNSHADVRPVFEGAWDFPAFSGQVANGLIYGRGAVDAKGPLICYLFALDCALRIAGGLRGDITFQSVVDEERGGNGTLACLLKGYTADAALVGEPTSLAICPGTRGGQLFSLTVGGREAHSGVAFEGVNAIRNTCRYIEALYQLQDDLDRTHPHVLWNEFPIAHTFNVGTIRGGKFAGVVPDFCEAEILAGCIGDESLALLQEWVNERLDQVTQEDPFLVQNPPRVQWLNELRFEPSVTNLEHPFIQALAGTFSEIQRDAAKIHAMSAASDMRFLVNVGDIPSTNFGPGDPRLGHSSNERISIEELVEGAKVVTEFILRWCG